jgi:predicted DNA-binding transcriptional regulator AlpA
MRHAEPSPPERRVTLPEAAQRLGVSRQQAWNLYKSGRLPATYARGRYWVRSEHLTLFMRVPRPVGRPRRATRAERRYDRTPRRYGGHQWDHLLRRDPAEERLQAAVMRGSWRDHTGRIAH